MSTVAHAARQLQRKHIEPVIEVRPEFFLADAATRSRSWRRSRAHRCRWSDCRYALELPLLQHAQQLTCTSGALHRSRRENGARMASSNAHAPLDGPLNARSCPRARFDQADRKSGAIHLDERLVGPLAGGVDPRAISSLPFHSRGDQHVASVGAPSNIFQTSPDPRCATISRSCDRLELLLQVQILGLHRACSCSSSTAR